MKATDLLNKKLSKASLIAVCVMVFHVAVAKSDAISPETFNKSHGLILNLPAEDIKTEDSSWSTHSLAVMPKSRDNNIIASGSKKTPLNVDCGMDVYQNTGPDISLTSRLTGECDFKYHY